MTMIMSKSIFQTLPRLIGAIGQADFYAQVNMCLGKVKTISNFKVFSYPKSEKPALLAGSREPELDQIYCDYAYLMDPFYQVISKKQRSELVTLDSITAQDFESSTYYDCFYHKIGWKNEANLIVSLNDDRTICLAYTAEKAPIEQLNYELRPYLESLKAAIQKHEYLAYHDYLQQQALIGHGTTTSNESLSPEHLMDAFGLTKREKEVVQYILQGLTSPHIAEKCFVSEGTIKNHRKNIYRKLNIHSQSDLFRKFMN